MSKTKEDKIIELLEKIARQVGVQDKNAPVELSKPKRKIRPEEGEVYWRLWSDSDPNGNIYDSESDSKVWDAGNGFFTREEAEKELAKRKARQKIKEYIIENGLEFGPNWGDKKQEKYCIEYNHETKQFYFYHTRSSQSLSPFYFAGALITQTVIDNCKDSLLILFDVKE